MFAFDNTLVSPDPVNVTLGLVLKLTAFVKLCLCAVNVILFGVLILPSESAEKVSPSAWSITSYKLLGITVVAFAEPWKALKKLFCFPFLNTVFLALIQ